MPAILEETPVATEQPKPNPQTPAREAIELRAYFHYIERGCADGCALDDWLIAEEELRREAEEPPR